MMPEKKQKPLDHVELRQIALSCWENEGGAKAPEKEGSLKVNESLLYKSND